MPADRSGPGGNAMGESDGEIMEVAREALSERRIHAFSIEPAAILHARVSGIRGCLDATMRNFNMKRYLTPLLTPLLMVAMLPSIASAQSGELRRDRDEIRRAERDLDRAERYGQQRQVEAARNNLDDARREYRADWRDYRIRNRELYARGGWRAPFRYERFARGARLQPSYYDRRYFIADYRRYHLPSPPPHARWVRHYDDMILVSLRSGRVLDVIYGVFW